MKKQYILLVLGWLIGLMPTLAQTNPYNLTGSASAYNRVDLSWKDNYTTETGFTIERNDFSGFQKIDEVGAGIVTYQDKTVQGSGAYTYRVRAIVPRSTVGIPYSNEVTVNTPPEPPTTPTNLDATLQPAGQIRISWTNPGAGSASEFLLERANASGGPFQQIKVVPYSRTPTYDDNEVVSGMQYCYRVQARGPGGTSAYSNVDCVTKPLVPTSVVNLKAEAINSTSIKLTWNGYGKESSIAIERRRGRTGNWEKIKDWLADGGEYTDTGLEPGTEYCYRIGESGHEYSAEPCATTPAVTPVAPVAPSQLNVLVVSESQLQLFWTDINTQTVTFEISRADSPGGAYKVIHSDYPQKIYDDKELTASTQYCYRVRAKNSAGLYSDYSNEACKATRTPTPTAPSAPARLDARAVAYNQINLQWTDLSTNETGFELERSTDGGRSFTKLRTLDANAINYVDSDVQASTQYCYRIRAFNDVGASAPTDPPACATTPAAPVGVPQNLTAVATSTTQIALSWSAVAGASGYQLERSPNGTDGWQTIGPSPATATSFVDNGRAPNTRYYYRVRSLNAAGSPGDVSNVVNAITPDVPPQAPANLTITAVTYNQVSLKWEDSATNETGFQVERSPDGTSWNALTNAGENTTTYNDQSVAAETRYAYRVRAVNGAGSSEASNVVETTTPAGPPVGAQDLKATPVSSTQISLTWGAIPNAATIVIERSPDGSSGWSSLTSVVGNTTSYTDNGLTPNVRYYYRIRASNASGTGPNSNVADAITPDIPPAPPVSLTVTVQSPTQINLQWADQSTNESGFEVEQGSSATGSFTRIADLPASSTTYEVKGLIDNTSYCYRVRAKNAAGFSNFTEPVCATTPLAPPATPTSLQAQLVDYDQVQLTWDALPAKEVTVIIERSTSPTSGFTEIKRQPASQTGYVDVGLLEFTTYHYRIQAINTAGSSAYSNVASAQVAEIIIAVEDELATHTNLLVQHKTLHIVTNWYQPMHTTVRLLTSAGQVMLTDNRRVQVADTWNYPLDRLPAGIYIISIIAEGRKLAKRIVLP